MSKEKAKFNLNQPLLLTEQEINMCINICSLLPLKGHMFEEFPLFVLAFASHKGYYFDEILAEPQATIKGDYEFLFPIQTMEEIILELNGYEEEVLSNMDDWSNGSTSSFPMSLAGL